MYHIGSIDSCMLNFFHSTITFNFIQWFMILFSFSNVKYSLCIFCVEYVLTKNIIILLNQTRNGPSMLGLLREIDKYPHTCLGLYLFTKVAKWQQLVSRNIDTAYKRQLLLIIFETAKSGHLPPQWIFQHHFPRLRQIFFNVLQARKKYRCENLAAHPESHR